MSESQFAGLFVTAAMADVSTAAAVALNKATEALRIASEAMSNAATVYTSQSNNAPSHTTTVNRRRETFLHDSPPTLTQRKSSLQLDLEAMDLLHKPSQEALLPMLPSNVANPGRKRYSGPDFNHGGRHYSGPDFTLGGLDRTVARREGLTPNSFRNSIRRSRRYEEVEGQLNADEIHWVRSLQTDITPRPPPLKHSQDFTPTTAVNPSFIDQDYQHVRKNQHNMPSSLRSQPSHTSSSIHGHPPPPKLALPQEIGFLLVVCLANFLAQAGLAITISPLPQETTTFQSGGHIPSPPWYSAAYALTLGTFILPSGRLGDVYGHRPFFLFGLLWLAVTSILCGFAPYMAERANIDAELWFVFMRALQGLGTASLMPNGMALLGRMYVEGNKKNMIFALFGWNAPLGFVMGAVFCALFAQRIGWQWGFFLNGIFCLCIFSLAYFVVPDLDAVSEAHREKGGKSKGLDMSWKESMAKLDLKGSFLGVSGLILLNVSLNQAPVVGWATQYTYFLTIIAGIFLVLFVLSQRPASNPHPLVPLDVMDSRTLFVLSCTFLGWSAFGVWIFYTWDFMLTADLGPHLSSLGGAAWFTPAPVAGLFASAATGFLLSKLHPRWLQLFSMLAFFIGTTIMATVATGKGTSTSTSAYFTGAFWSIVIMPWGMDMSFPSATILLSNSLGHDRQGLAASLANTVVNYSISIGLGIAGTVVRYTKQHEESGPTAPLARMGESGVGDIRHGIFTSMGLAGLGVVVSCVFVGRGLWEDRRKMGFEREVEQVGIAV